jgi:DNA-binding NtrC family response regulator
MAERPTILIVDDEHEQRRLLAGFLQPLGYAVREAESAERALEILAQERPALVLLDVRLPGMSGVEALPAIRQLAADLPVLLVTAYADLRQAVAAMKSGADDYLAKPLDLEELEAAIADHLGRRTTDESRPLPPVPEGLVCHSAAMQRVLQTAAVVAPSEAPVLVLGPSGAGKEVVARLIHAWSGRATGPLVAANCAGLPESLIESELFGHEKGAFTGASHSRQGFFRAADGGTLFLDEIGELPLHLQPKLLRALEAKQVTPVGSDAPVSCDARLVAATNRDLAEAAREGRFREDLYYRINVVELLVPALAERADDILPLARHFAAEFGHGPVRLSPHTVQCLLSYRWPGNVRELRNAVQRACLLARGDVILPEHLPPKVAALGPSAVDEPGGRLSQIERATILATLAECNQNRTHAAKKLGISRRALIYKLRAMESDAGKLETED